MTTQPALSPVNTTVTIILHKGTPTITENLQTKNLSILSHVTKIDMFWHDTQHLVDRFCSQPFGFLFLHWLCKRNRAGSNG